MTITHAGVAVQAADTGRILMIQRTLDPTDPPQVQGTWEFPGGGLEEGEKPEAAAWREFSEETGLAQPAGEITGSWTSTDGVYQAFVFTTPTEADAFGEMNPDHQAAVAENPDDPGRQAPDVQAWFTVDQIQGLGPALRPEVAEQTQWDQFATSPAPVSACFTVAAARATVDRARRTISGTLVRYGETGQTTIGPLRVKQIGALRPDHHVTLTPEHENDVRRGQLALVDDTAERMRVAVKVDDGPLGDAALDEAESRERGGLSFWVEDPVLEPATDGGAPWLVAARLTHIGQVADPAFNSSRIDHIAATKTPGASRTNTGGIMTEEQRQRLAELRAMETRTDEQETEFAGLVALAVDEAAPEAPAAEGDQVPADGDPAPEGDQAPQATAPVAAGRPVPAVPGGIPLPRARTRERGKSYNQVVKEVTSALQSQALTGTSAVNAIGAAFTDVISTAHTGNIEPVAWSGELWSGLEYQPVFLDLLAPANLEWFEGKGWRFTVTPEMQDYDGDKAAVPSGTVTTEPSEYEAERMAVGVDIDRKFYDFPNEAFVDGLFQRIRESWTIKQDGKVRSYITTNATKLTQTVTAARTSGETEVDGVTGTFTPAMIGSSITGTGIPANTVITDVSTGGSSAELSNAASSGTATATVLTIDRAEASVLKAAGRLVQGLKNTRVGSPSFIVMNDDDYFSLMDINEQTLPSYLDLWGIDPKNFRSSPDVTAGTIIGGAKQAAKYRTLPGSPIRVSAQHLANGGIDEAFFGYWAIEKHHPQGIRSIRFQPNQ